MDYFDILDENGKPTGYTRSRVEAHEQGLWHRTVHVWVVNARGEVLLQKRAPGLVSRPGKWDISVGGHIHAGESSMDAAIRETKEELGFNVNPDELKFLFTTNEQTVQNNKTFINNEFNDIYLLRRYVSLGEINLDLDEVTKVKYMPAKEVLTLMKNNDRSIVDHAEELDKLITYIK